MSPKNVINNYAVVRKFLELVVASKIRGMLQIIVFGSVAKNIANIHSDIDILVLLKNDEALLKEKIRHLAYKAMMDDNFSKLISLHFLTEKRFKELAKAGFTFEKEISSAGVPIWKAA